MVSIQGYDIHVQVTQHVQALEEMIAVLENGHAGFAFVSEWLLYSDIICSQKVTTRYFNNDVMRNIPALYKLLKPFGIELYICRIPTNFEEVEEAIRPKYEANLCETTNEPTTKKLLIFKKISTLAKRESLLTIID